MMRRGKALAGMCASWLCLCGFAPEEQPSPLPYDPSVLEQDPALGQPGDPSEANQTARRATRNGSYLTVDVGVVADSNITNGTGLHAIEITDGGSSSPIEIDPAFRRRSGIGQSVAINAGVRLPVSDRLAAAVDAEAQVSNFGGKAGDDISLLVAAGPELTLSPASVLSVQATAFDRWFAGFEASRGIGVRARLQQRIAEGDNLYLFLDARVFESEYGPDFEGTQSSAYLSYEDLLTPSLKGTVGLYIRREWLGSATFSNVDFGAYGGLDYFLPLGLKGGFSLGVGRILFDEPFLFFSPEPRRDLRLNGSIYLMPRKAVLFGLWPQLSYSYTRTLSTIDFYRTDRHRLRLGVARYW